MNSPQFHSPPGLARSLALALALAAAVLSCAPGSSFGASIQGLPNGGSVIGQYVISGQTYWWLEINPNTPPLDDATQNGAQINPVALGWATQDWLNRHVADDALAKQTSIIEYVLDANLPWDTLAGASGRFLEQNGDYHNYTTNDPFLNAMFAAEAFIVQLYPRTTQSDFTNLSDFTDPFASLGDATDDARSALLQSILTDVAAKDAAGYFANYTAQHGYEVVTVPVLDGGGGLFLASFTPVPEPGSALLLAVTGLLATLRRRRSRYHA